MNTYPQWFAYNKKKAVIIKERSHSMNSTTCLFCRIVAQEIPAQIITSNEDAIIIKDINPRADLHWLIIPRKHFEDMRLLNAPDGPLLASLMLLGINAIRTYADNTAFRVVVNNGAEVGQHVFHSHIHLLGGSIPNKSEL